MSKTATYLTPPPSCVSVLLPVVCLYIDGMEFFIKFPYQKTSQHNKKMCSADVHS